MKTPKWKADALLACSNKYDKLRLRYNKINSKVRLINKYAQKPGMVELTNQMENNWLSTEQQLEKISSNIENKVSHGALPQEQYNFDYVINTHNTTLNNTIDTYNAIINHSLPSGIPHLSIESDTYTAITYFLHILGT